MKQIAQNRGQRIVLPFVAGVGIGHGELLPNGPLVVFVLTLRYFTDASYWVYLSNMPLVMLWHVMLAPLDMSIYVKFPISLLGAFGMSMLTYEYMVRYTWMGAVLNKRRVRNPT